MLSGGLITLAVAMTIEFLRRPKLTISIKRPDDFLLGAAQAQARSLKLIIKNEPLPPCASWMLRGPALQARGTIVFRHLDGRQVFGRTMEARWAGTPEPIPIPVVGPGDQAFQIIDFARFASGTRMDIYPGDEEELDLVERIEPDQECYGWNNESYFDPSVRGRNPNWKLPPGRYLVEVTIRSSGQSQVASFALINDGRREDMRLETVMDTTNTHARLGFNPVRWLCNLKPIELFTAVLCLVGGIQAWAFIQSERAFVFPSHLEFVEPPAISESLPILLSLDMRNSGRSVAQVSRMVVAVTHQLPPTPNYEKGLDRTEVAFPPVPGNGQTTQQLYFKEWAAQTFREVQNGSRAFYLFGNVIYSDDYWLLGTRSSRFCFVYVANKSDPSKGNFRNCTEPQYTGTE